MFTAHEIAKQPIRLLEMAEQHGIAEIDFLEDEQLAKHFYRRLRQLNIGRGRKHDCWIRRDGCIVRAINDPAQMPTAVVRS